MIAAGDPMVAEKEAKDAIRRAHIATIRKLRNSLCEPLESVEWRALPITLKKLSILMAGLDEGHEKKAFLEFTPPERLAIKLQLRLMKRSLAPLISLTGW